MPFYDHIFFDHLLEGLPEKGPVRSFMEVTCLGFSRNPYISVARKHENILWYKEFFLERKQLLEECGAWDVEEDTRLKDSV